MNVTKRILCGARWAAGAGFVLVCLMQTGCQGGKEKEPETVLAKAWQKAEVKVTPHYPPMVVAGRANVFRLTAPKQAKKFFPGMTFEDIAYITWSGRVQPGGGQFLFTCESSYTDWHVSRTDPVVVRLTVKAVLENAVEAEADIRFTALDRRALDPKNATREVQFSGLYRFVYQGPVDHFDLSD